MQQENVITLDNSNSIKIIIQYVELAQQKGCFLLSEAELLKRAVDVCNSSSDPEINLPTAKNLIIQGIVKGQQKGAYTLTDASLLHKVVTFIEANLNSPVTNETTDQGVTENTSENDFDLSDLSDPIPLKPKEI